MSIRVDVAAQRARACKTFMAQVHATDLSGAAAQRRHDQLVGTGGKLIG